MTSSSCLPCPSRVFVPASCALRRGRACMLCCAASVHGNPIGVLTEKLRAFVAARGLPDSLMLEAPRKLEWVRKPPAYCVIYSDCVVHACVAFLLCMYACMHVCMYACMHGYMDTWTHTCFCGLLQMADVLLLPENCMMDARWDSAHDGAVWTLLADAVGASRVARRARIDPGVPTCVHVYASHRLSPCPIVISLPCACPLLWLVRRAFIVACPSRARLCLATCLGTTLPACLPPSHVSLAVSSGLKRRSLC